MKVSSFFIFESSFSAALPADDEDKKALYAEDDPSEFVFAGNGGYAFWDNGAYVDICVHISPGKWETVDNQEQYQQIPPDVQKQYVQAAGAPWPAPGGALKRIASDVGVNPFTPPKKNGPSN